MFLIIQRTFLHFHGTFVIRFIWSLASVNSVPVSIVHMYIYVLANMRQNEAHILVYYNIR